MILYGAPSTPYNKLSLYRHSQHGRVVVAGVRAGPTRAISLASTGLAAVMLTVVVVVGANAVEESETLSNIPQELSGVCITAKDCKKAKIQRPKSRKAESCTIKCVTTCIRGGYGAPGEGPLNVRRPLVVFKEGFRSRQYWYIFAPEIYLCYWNSIFVFSTNRSLLILFSLRPLHDYYFIDPTPQWREPHALGFPFSKILVFDLSSIFLCIPPFVSFFNVLVLK